MTRPSRLLSARSAAQAAAELSVIVVGILLALGIDGWVEARDEAGLEVHYLALLVRDLDATEESLDRFIAVNERTRAAGVEGYRMLHLPVDRIDGDRLSATLEAAGTRLTPRLPRAAYTELLSSGSLRLIRDRTLRDDVVRFYEEADRRFTVLDKNATLAADTYMGDRLAGEGLLYPALDPGVDSFEGLLVRNPNEEFLAELDQGGEAVR